MLICLILYYELMIIWSYINWLKTGFVTSMVVSVSVFWKFWVVHCTPGWNGTWHAWAEVSARGPARHGSGIWALPGCVLRHGHELNGPRTGPACPKLLDYLGAVMLEPWGRCSCCRVGGDSSRGQAGKKRWHFGKTARKLSRVTCIDAHGKFANYSKSRF
jgi:hypothetical protein